MGDLGDELRELRRRSRRGDSLANPGVRRPTPVWALQERDDQMRQWSRRHGADVDLWGAFVASVVIATLAIAELVESGSSRWPVPLVVAVAFVGVAGAVALALVSSRRAAMKRAVLVGRVMWAVLVVAVTLGVRAI